METVYIVAILAVVAGIVVVVVLLRKRLTHLDVRHGRSRVTFRAKAQAPTAAPDRGIALDNSKVSGSKVKLENSTFIARDSKVKDSQFESSGATGSGDQDDG